MKDSKSGKIRVLLVDDDESLSETLKLTMERLGFEVSCATDGISAKSLIAVGSFDVVLSDIRMPNLNGIELLHFIKRTNPEIPVILMTGYSEISETKEAIELGAKGFLPKPFSAAKLAELIGGLCKSECTPAGAASQDHLFSHLRIEEFVTGREILYDIHVRLSESNYVKVAVKGEPIAMERITKYREKNVKYLYLTKEDFRKYLGFTVNLAKKVAESDAVDHERKLRFLTNSTMGFVKDLYLEEVDMEQFSQASDLLMTTLGVMGDDPQTLAIFDVIRQHSDFLYAHSVAVSLYSVLIAKEVGWKSPRTCMRLSMCGLVHDIGKKELPKELIEKPRPLLTPEELQLLESHPARGAELLRYLAGLPEDVAVVAMQHHEDCKGTGYPGHLTRHRIMPLSRLVAVANEFCTLVFPAPGYPGMLAKDALVRLMASSSGRYDEEFVNGLYKVVHPLSKPGKKIA
ncbi:MAG: response regulator [Bdellovibrionota bacterium]